MSLDASKNPAYLDSLQLNRFMVNYFYAIKCPFGSFDELIRDLVELLLQSPNRINTLFYFGTMAFFEDQNDVRQFRLLKRTKALASHQTLEEFYRNELFFEKVEGRMLLQPSEFNPDLGSLGVFLEAAFKLNVANALQLLNARRRYIRRIEMAAAAAAPEEVSGKGAPEASSPKPEVVLAEAPSEAAPGDISDSAEMSSVTSPEASPEASPGGPAEASSKSPFKSHIRPLSLSKVPDSGLRSYETSGTSGAAAAAAAAAASAIDDGFDEVSTGPPGGPSIPVESVTSGETESESESESESDSDSEYEEDEEDEDSIGRLGWEYRVGAVSAGTKRLASHPVSHRRPQKIRIPTSEKLMYYSFFAREYQRRIVRFSTLKALKMHIVKNRLAQRHFRFYGEFPTDAYVARYGSLSLEPMTETVFNDLWRQHQSYPVRPPLTIKA